MKGSGVEFRENKRGEERRMELYNLEYCDFIATCRILQPQQYNYYVPWLSQILNHPNTRQSPSASFSLTFVLVTFLIGRSGSVEGIAATLHMSHRLILWQNTLFPYYDRGTCDQLFLFLLCAGVPCSLLVIIL